MNSLVEPHNLSFPLACLSGRQVGNLSLRKDCGQAAMTEMKSNVLSLMVFLVVCLSTPFPCYCNIKSPIITVPLLTVMFPLMIVFPVCVE